MAINQSDILGFDTRRFISEPMRPDRGKFESVRGALSKATSVLANLFDRGLEIYGGVRQRINALKQIESETVPKSQPVEVLDITHEKPSRSNNKGLIIGLGLLGAMLLAIKK